jgi:hypothetical protein
MDTRVAFVAPGAVAVGIVLGDARGPGAAGSVLVVVGLGVVALVVARSVRVRSVLFLLVLLAGGCALEQRALDGLAHGAVVAAASAREEVRVHVTLLEDPSGTRWSTSALAAIRWLDVTRGPRAHRPAVHERRTVVLVADGDAVGRLAVLAAGDEAVLQGWLRPLEGFDERLRWKHAAARLDVLELAAVEQSAGLLATIANGARGIVLRGTDVLPAEERALVAGFLLETRAISIRRCSSSSATRGCRTCSRSPGRTWRSCSRSSGRCCGARPAASVSRRPLPCWSSSVP